MSTTAERRAQRAAKHRAPTPIVGPSEPDTIDLDEDIASLLLRQVAGARKRVQAADRIVSGDITRTMEGASTLTVTIHDADRQVLRSGVFGADQAAPTGLFRSLTVERKTYDRLAAVDVQVDGVWFRLAQLSVQDDDLVLTFEDREVSYLREHQRNERVSRSKMTRAEFVHMLVRKVHIGEGIKFESPDEHVRQAIAAPQETAAQKRKRVTKATKQSARDAKKVPGFSKSDPITVKKTPANQRQLKVLENVLDVGRQLGASPKVMQAAIVTVTQESDAGENNQNAGNTTVIGAFQQDASYGDLLARQDVRHAAYGFFQKAIANNKSNPALSVADLAESVQKSGQPGNYATWTDEAAHTVSTYLGGDLAGLQVDSSSGSGAASTRTYAKSYQFTVGQPGKPESYWDAIQRLADEIQWRAFMDRGTLWFISDETLMRQRPRLTISEPLPGATSRATRGVEKIDFDWDTGKAALEATVTARTGRWQAPPGCVINITNSGAADGRWLVWSIQRDLFDALATITLRRPHRQKKEPAHETNTVTLNAPGKTGGAKGTVGAAGAAYKAAQAIGAKKYAYSYGGGHNAAFSPPYDCSGFVSAVLHDAGLLDQPLDTVGFGSYGVAGKGQYMTIWVNPQPGQSGHVFLEFDPPGGKPEIYEAGGYQGGPTGLRPAGRSTAGFEARHVPGT